jgi:hypothetical protein
MRLRSSHLSRVAIDVAGGPSVLDAAPPPVPLIELA